MHLCAYPISLFEPEPFNSYFSFKELFRSENHLCFHYDAFRDFIWDSLNADSPWYQCYWDNAKAETMLVVNDPVFKEWWAKYPGFEDCCWQSPGHCAIEYENNTESHKDPLS